MIDASTKLQQFLVEAIKEEKVVPIQKWAQDCSKDPVLEFDRRMQNLRRVWSQTWALTVLPGFIVFGIFAVGRNQPFIGMIGFAVLAVGVMRGLYLQYTYSRCPQCGTHIKATFFPLGLHCPGCGVQLIRRG